MTRSTARCYFLGLVLYALLLALYIGLRFGWRWLDGDAGMLTVISRNVYVEGTVAPTAGAYPHGYAYPVLNTCLARVSGVSVVTLQTYIQPFLITLLVPISYAAFRAMLGNPTAASLACLLLFLQPDFLFEAVRSSHAKFTWLLALIMLFVLAHSFRVLSSGRASPKWVLLFYLLAYGLIASNAFFASSYVFALAYAFLGGWVLARWHGPVAAPAEGLRRLLYVALACSILVFLFVFYIYSPAKELAGFFQTVLDRVSGFLLDVETGTDPYQYVRATWISPGLYLILSSLNWLVLALSFANWAHKAWALLWRREALPPARLLLWLLYTAFAFLLAMGVVLDLSGALSANLQVRLFPHLMFVAIPQAAEVLVVAIVAAWRRGHRARWISVALLVGATLFFSIASLFKATNEPLLSNRWAFYLPEERAAISWAGPHLAGPWVWLGPDHRLRPVVRTYGDWDQQGIEEYAGLLASDGFDVLLSELIEVQAARLALRLPDVRRRLQVYDNGGATLYHARPRTPYQR